MTLSNKGYRSILFTLTVLICLLSNSHILASSERFNLKEYINQISYSTNLDDAELFAKKAFQEVDKRQDLAGKAEIYLALGEAYYNQAHPTLPKQYFNKAFEIANELNSPMLQLKAHRNIARVYNKEGQYHLAIEHFIKSLDLARKLKNPHYVFTNYISLSISYNDQQKPDQSLIYSNAAISDSNSIPKNIKNVTISSMYMCMGRSYWLKHDLKKAEDYTIKAIQLTIGKDIRITKTRGWAYSNLGDIYMSEQKYDEALLAYNRALITFGQIGGEFGFQRIYTAMAKTLLLQGKTEEALLLAIKAHKLAKKVDIWLDIKESAKLIADIYRSKRNFEKAYTYHIEYTKAKDSLEGIENLQRIQELQTRYETSEKENLIGLQQAKIEAKDTALAKRRVEASFLWTIIISITFVLLALIYVIIKVKRTNIKIKEQQSIIELSNKKLKEQKTDLEQINQAKNKLFSIIGHDLISQVGTTKEFLSLMTSNPNDFENSEKRKVILESLYSTSLNTYSLLENLIAWSKNERGIQSFMPINQKLRPVIEEIVASFKFQSHKKNIAIVVDGDLNKTAIFDRNGISTVLRNLLGNAIKYSNNGTSITIKLTETHSDIYISIIDQGIGIETETINAIVEGKGIISHLGTENEKGNGLGLSLCNDLIKMHGKQLEVTSCKGIGTTFTFALSKKSSENS